MNVPRKQRRLAEAILEHDRDTFSTDLLDSAVVSAWALRGLRERGAITRADDGLWTADRAVLLQITDTAGSPGISVEHEPDLPAVSPPSPTLNTNGDLLRRLLYDGPITAGEVAVGAGISLRVARWRLRRMAAAGLVYCAEDDGEIVWIYVAIDDEDDSMRDRAADAGFDVEAGFDGGRRHVQITHLPGGAIERIHG